MGNLVATEYLSLDGVFEEPGNWSFPFWSDEAATFKLDELKATDALLLGRKTYEGFAAAWPSMTDEAGFAERMNGLPKYVASTTLKQLDWNNSHLIEANVVEEVARLKAQPGRDLVLHGSGELLHTLRQHDLVDEYRIMLHPIVLGHGRRLFREEGVTQTLRLVDTKVFGSGIVVLTYRPASQD